jgi:histidine ammonia-lyase
MRTRTSSRPVAIDGHSLTLEDVERVARGAHAALTSQAKRRVVASRRAVDDATRGGRQVYGVNTGFGQLAGVGIPKDKLAELQVNLIRSHAAGTGTPLADDIVRAILALRANCLARGHSGIRLATLLSLLDSSPRAFFPVPSRDPSGRRAISLPSPTSRSA